MEWERLGDEVKVIKMCVIVLILARTCNNVCGHDAIIIETKSTHVMIKSTLWFDDVEDIPGLLPLSGWFKGHVCSQGNGAGDGLGMRLLSQLTGYQ